MAGGLIGSPPAWAGPSVAADPDGSVVAVTSKASGRIDLFTVGAQDRSLHYRTFTDGQWSGWEDLGGGPFRSAPSVVSWEPGHLDVFVRGGDDRLKHRYMLNSGPWSGWEDLGGGLSSAPSATSMRRGHIDVFYRGTDNALWHRFYDKTWQQSDSSLGGELTSAPSAVSWGDGHIDVFSRGTDNALYHRYFLNNAWSGWSSLGGRLTSAPSAASWEKGHVDVFARGEDNALQHRWFGTNWRDWDTVAGSLASAPAATSWGKGHLTVFGLDDKGDLQQSTFRSSGGWPALQRVFGLAPAVAQPRFSRVSVRQNSPVGGAVSGAIDYSYVDNLGTLRYVRQTNPDSTASGQFSVVTGDESFAGRPVLAEQQDGRIQVAAHVVDGDIWAVTQRDRTQTGWADPVDLGGWLTSGPTSGRLPDGRLALFGVDADGRVWARIQTAVNGAYGSWVNLGGSDLAEAPVVAAARGGVQLFGLDRSGVLRTATYLGSAAKLDWQALSPAGMSGTPAVVPYPGLRSRVVLRRADGVLFTRLQENDGSWPGEWQQIGDFQAAGAPAAILDPTLGRVAVMARGADDQIHRVWETAQASGVWGSWAKAIADNDPAASDPTVAPVTNSNGQTFIVAFRAPNDIVRVYERELLSAAGGVSALSVDGKPVPGFAAGSLPKPPSGR